MKMRLISYGTIIFLTLICLAGTASARVINDPEYGFQITIPNNWQTNSFMDGTDKVWAFAAPDNNAAIRIRSFKAPARLTMEALISAFETHILSGGQRLTIAPYTLNGINGKMAGYKGRFNNTDVGVGCFFTIQKKHAYIVWSMIPVSLFNARSGETDAILNTFSLSGIKAPYQKDVQQQITGEWTIYTGGFVGSADEMKTFYKGTLVISSNGTILNATINFDVYNRVEVLQSVKFINNQLTFTRPGVPQYYQARLSGGKLFGTFQHQQHTQRWWAEKKTDMPDAEDRDFQYQMLVLDDSGFEFLYPKHFQRFQQSEGQSQWADPHAAVGSRVVMAMQTMSRSMGNSLTSVHGKLINQVRGNSAAKLLSSNQLRVNGIPAYELRFTLRQQNQLKYFYYLVMDVQGPNVAAVSFVGPESMLKEIKQHFDKLKASVKQVKMSSNGGKPATPPQTGEADRPDRYKLAPLGPPARSVSHIDLSEFPLFVTYTWDAIPEKLIARPEASAFPLPAYDTVEERKVSGGRIQKDYKKNGRMVAAQLFEDKIYKAISIWKPDGRGRVYVAFWRDGSVSGIEYIEGMYKQGICRYWDERGGIIKIVTYRDNKLDGAEVSWYSSPTHSLRRIAHYKRGNYHGLYRNYFQINRGLEEESQWKDGVWLKRTYYTESGEVRSVLK